MKKQKFFFDFQKVYNELGKVTKFRISRPLISWRKSQQEKVQANCAPPTPLGFKDTTNFMTLVSCKEMFFDKLTILVNSKFVGGEPFLLPALADGSVVAV